MYNLDDIALILLSYYNAVISIEKFLSSLLIISLYINSATFLLSYILYIFTLKYDLHYISLNLMIRPDLEYFVDLDESEKFTYWENKIVFN